MSDNTKREADERAAREEAASLKAEEDKRRADASVQGFGLSQIEPSSNAQKAADCRDCV